MISYFEICLLWSRLNFCLSGLTNTNTKFKILLRVNFSYWSSAAIKAVSCYLICLIRLDFTSLRIYVTHLLGKLKHISPITAEYYNPTHIYNDKYYKNIQSSKKDFITTGARLKTRLPIWEYYLTRQNYINQASVSMVALFSSDMGMGQIVQGYLVISYHLKKNHQVHHDIRASISVFCGISMSRTNIVVPRDDGLWIRQLEQRYIQIFSSVRVSCHHGRGR